MKTVRSTKNDERVRYLDVENAESESHGNFLDLRNEAISPDEKYFLEGIW